MQNSQTLSKVTTCPFLGLREDPGSYLGNPSPGNYCYHCKVPTSPLTLHQETYCLTGGQAGCSVYQQDAKKPFPHALQGVDGMPEFRSSSTLRNFGILIGIGLVVLLGWLFFQYYLNGTPIIPISVPASATPVVTPLATNIQSAVVLPTETPVPPTKVPNPTATLAPTLTKTPPQRHALEIPVKVDNQEYMIHLVMDGEGFDFLAKTYKTSVNVLKAINYSLPPAIWVNFPIVVAQGVTTINPALPALQAYKVVEQISIDDLAKKLQVDAALLKHFNACPDGCVLAKGDWVLIPHTK